MLVKEATVDIIMIINDRHCNKNPSDISVWNSQFSSKIVSMLHLQNAFKTALSATRCMASTGDINEPVHQDTVSYDLWIPIAANKIAHAKNMIHRNSIIMTMGIQPYVNDLVQDCGISTGYQSRSKSRMLFPVSYWRVETYNAHNSLCSCNGDMIKLKLFGIWNCTYLIDLADVNQAACLKFICHFDIITLHHGNICLIQVCFDACELDSYRQSFNMNTGIHVVTQVYRCKLNLSKIKHFLHHLMKSSEVDLIKITSVCGVI